MLRHAAPCCAILHRPLLLPREMTKKKKKELMALGLEGIEARFSGRLSVSGLVGVSKRKRPGTPVWKALVGNKYMGLYDTAEEAALAYNEAALALYPGKEEG
jgi:hypothetical protein